MGTTDLHDAIRALAREYHMLPSGKTVLCAVSGGGDSMALLHSLLALREEFGYTLCAAHYDHGLRGEDSLRDAIFVTSYCRDIRIPLRRGAGDVAGEAARQGLGIEDCARQMRYAFLEDAARHYNATRIVTAHHADDNLETLLLRLLRGSGLRGLTGIPPVRGQIVRPMLEATRAQIEAYLTKNRIPHTEDGSNADPSFLRNYLRAEVVPLLTARSPNLIALSARTMRSLREDQDVLMAQATALYRQARRAEDGLVLPRVVLSANPRALGARLVQLLLEGIEAAPPEASHIDAILAIAQGDDPSAAVTLPGGVLVQRVYDDILFAWSVESEPLAPMETVPVVIGGVTQPPDVPWRLHCRAETCPEDEPSDGTFYLAREAVQGALCLRARQTGDELALPNRRRKSLKKLMIEMKLPRRVRERVPVLADEGGVLAVMGLGPARERLAQPGQAALAFRWEAALGG